MANCHLIRRSNSHPVSSDFASVNQSGDVRDCPTGQVPHVSWKKAGWLPGTGFDAYPWHHPVTESSYINSLANRPFRSTVKTLPATLPEPSTMVRGPRSKHLGPWSTDFEPWIVDSVSRLKLRGSRLVDAEPGLVGLVARSETNWVEGWGVGLAVIVARTHKIFEAQSHPRWSK